MSISLEERSRLNEEMKRAIEDSNAEFWSKKFNEDVYRLVSQGKINADLADRFFRAEKGFTTEVLFSDNGFKREEQIIRITH